MQAGFVDTVAPIVIVKLTFDERELTVGWLTVVLQVTPSLVPSEESKVS
jgi:hypothetical protein